MKATDSQIQFEPSIATKRLQRATRKSARALGKNIHPGLVQTSNPGRDVFLTILAVLLELASLGVMHHFLKFHLGIVAGMMAFDFAGALLLHVGIGDRNWRRALAAGSQNEKARAAVLARKLFRHNLARFCGVILILLPLVAKIAGTVLLPGALVVLGGMAPALIVSFVAISGIHLFVTGYGLAHLRYCIAEGRERKKMLKESILGDAPTVVSMSDRGEANQNVIRGYRDYRFSSPQNFQPISHTGGHTLSLENEESGEYHYVLRTSGRFTDDDLDFFINGQHQSRQKLELSIEGLRHQISIEESEPLTSPVSESPGDPGPLLKAVSSIMVFMFALSLVSCETKEAKSVGIVVVSDRPLVGTGEFLPEPLLGIVAPENPIAGSFVPRSELLRIDLASENVKSLDFVSGSDSTTSQIMQKAWKAKSAGLGLARLAVLRKTKFPLAWKEGVGASESELDSWVNEQLDEGKTVVALGKKDTDSFKIARGLSVVSRASPQGVLDLISSAIQGGGGAEAVVLYYPDEYSEVITAVEKLPNKRKEVESEHEVELDSAEKGRLVTQRGDSNTLNVLINVDEGKSGVEVDLSNSLSPLGSPVYFESKSSKLNSRGHREIDQIVKIAKGLEIDSVLISAHSDWRGSETDNLALAEKRADTVVAALLAQGIDVSNVISVGEALSLDGTSYDEMEKDRSVIVYPSSQGDRDE